MKKRIMVDMSATLLHHGHIRLLKNASELGEVIVGLTSDKEIKSKKFYFPELSFENRKEILESIKYVSEVVETPWLINEKTLDNYNIDFLVHGDDNSNAIDSSKLKIFQRTEGISSSLLRERAVESVSAIKNQKMMLTPGPALILHENLKSLKPVFGRGDIDYEVMLESVSKWIKKISGQDELVISQGSSTFSLELAAHSFVKKNVLIISTGYYSDRLKQLISKNCNLTICNYDEISKINKNYDWILCAYTETSVAFKLDIHRVKKLADKCGAKLFVDATGSIGFEENHDLADVLAFSSCKGLFGLAGASFIAYKKDIKPIKNDLFYFNIETQIEKKVTGPYHAISSLFGVIEYHELLKQRVLASKSLVLDKWRNFTRKENHPLLCTYLEGKVSTKDQSVILYSPRSDLPGSVICHLGEIHHDELNILNRISIESI